TEWKTIGLITVFNVVLHHSFLAIGLTKTAGVNAGIILGAAPLVTMVLSVLFLHYRVSNIRVIGFLLGFFGILITSIAGTVGIAALSTGDFFIFLCILAQAISFILIVRLTPYFESYFLTVYMIFIGSLFIFFDC